jgi:hypothetical protein
MIRADERRAAGFDCVPAVITRLPPGAFASRRLDATHARR